MAGNRSAAVKKAWITRRRGRGGAAALSQKMKRAMSLSTGEMMHGATPKYTPSWSQVRTRLGRAISSGNKAMIMSRGAIGGSYIGGKPGSAARSAAFKRLVAYAKANKAEGNWGNS